MSTLAECFRYHRQHKRNATDAIKLARADIAANKSRYPSSYSGNGTSENTPFKSGSSMLQWSEDPSQIGLRFVGLAHDVYSGIKHTGWYSDDEGDNGETMRGVVYQWPARDGMTRYVAGYADPCNSNKDGTGPAALALSDIIEDKEQAARDADSIAEYAAEMSRDYNRAWQAGRKFEELGDEVKTMRTECLELIAEVKSACDKLTGYSAIKDTIKAQITEYVADIRKARKARAKLESDYGREPGFKDA